MHTTRQKDLISISFGVFLMAEYNMTLAQGRWRERGRSAAILGYQTPGSLFKFTAPLEQTVLYQQWKGQK